MKVIVIDEAGMTSLWDDDMAGEGADIERASEVEPDGCGRWTVKLADSALNGCFAGQYLTGADDAPVSRDMRMARRFDRRADALAAEVEFINRNILAKGVPLDGTNGI